MSHGPRRALLAGAVVAVALVASAAVLAGRGDDSGMTPAEAVAFTERALADAGVEATVGEPERGTFGTGQAAEDVWVVPAVVDGRTIAVAVDADGDQALNLADGLEDGSNVLSEEAFAALAQFRDDPRSEGLALPSALALLTAVATGVGLAAAIRGGRASLPAV